jgi:hypothetical protein
MRQVSSRRDLIGTLASAAGLLSAPSLALAQASPFLPSLPRTPRRQRNFNEALLEPQLSAETGRFFTGSLTSTPALTMVAFERCWRDVGKT